MSSEEIRRKIQDINEDDDEDEEDEDYDPSKEEPNSGNDGVMCSLD